MRALLLSLGVLASADAFAAPEVRCYPSGFKVAVAHREGPPLVGVATVVDGGSSTEQPSEIGAAHLLEHLWFRAPRLGYPTTDAWLADIGADANAYTSADDTIFLTVAHKRLIRTLLQAEADRLADPLAGVGDPVIAVEKRVVQNEIDQRHDGRNPALQAVLRQVMPEGDPYARPISGTHQQVERLERTDLQRYADRTYRAASSSLFISGNLPAEGVFRLVHEAFPPEAFADPADPSRVEPQPCPAAVDPGSAALPDPSTASWTEVEAAVDAPLAVVAWTVPSGRDHYPLAQMAAALMRWHLRKSTRMVDATCSIMPLARVSVVMCSAAAAAGRGEERWQGGVRAIDRLWNQSEDAWDSKFEYWLTVSEAVNKGLAREHSEDLELLSSAAGALEPSALAFHRAGQIHGDPGVDSVAAAAFARKWLTPERMRGVTLVPAVADKTGSSGFHGGRGQVLQDIVDPGPVDELRLARIAVDPGLDRIEARELSGRQVWVLEREGLQRSLYSAVFPGDASWADDGMRQRSWDLLEDPLDLMTQEDRYEAYRKDVHLWADQDDSFWSFTASGTGPTLPVRLLLAALPPPVRQVPRAEDKAAFEELEAWRAEAMQNANWVATHVRWKALADGLPHPYMDPEGFEALRRIPRSVARDFAEATLRPQRSRLVAVVPTGQKDTAFGAIHRTFGVASATDDFRASDPPTRQAAPRAVTVITAPDVGPQAAVVSACHIGDGDGVDLWILERALARGLNDALRNDLGVTYGVHPSFGYPAHGVTLTVSTRVPHDAAGVAVQSVLDTLGQIADKVLPEAALNRFKLEVARGTALRWQRPEDLLGLMQYAAARGIAPRDLALASRIAEVDAARLAERLAPCVDHEAITIVGDLERVEPALSAAGLPYSRL